MSVRVTWESMRERSAWACLWAVALVSGSCGGEGGKARDSCGRVQPCGGDLVGTWKPAGSCFDPTAVLAQVASSAGIQCPSGVTLTLTSSTLNRDITATFAANRTYSGTSVTTGMLAFDVPGACIGGETCGEVGAALAASFDAPSCTGNTTCACSVTQNLTSSETGTYTVSASVLETMPSGGTAVQTDYCVSGSQMHFINIDPATPTIISDAVLARQ